MAVLLFGLAPLSGVSHLSPTSAITGTGSASPVQLRGRDRIVVRRARQGETFISLDNKTRILDSEMLMICDGEKPVGIGGVMGGLNSEVCTSTQRVLLESACFQPVSIRRTAKRLNLNSEASHRFERGVDPRGRWRR